jgi:hypothetical protein
MQNNNNSNTHKTKAVLGTGASAWLPSEKATNRAAINLAAKV